MTLFKGLAVSLLVLFTSSVMADDAADLKAKLASVKLFSAHFQQTVLDIEGKKLQDSSGEMLVSRPDRFRWETKTPDENLIVSDGKDVWVYDPFVEQVSVMKLSAAVQNTPFLLITSSDPKLWNNYEILKEGNSFTVTSRKKNQRIESLRIIFDDNSQITRFEVNEAQGQRSEFQLSQLNQHPAIQADTFSFKVPNGVTVDDQR
jgi:outer membrane lipoprotein carrier protein